MANYDDNIGANIRQVRDKRGLSQSKLADKCEFSNTVLSNYETGKKIPSLQSIAKIAKQLGVTIDRLYYGDENETFITAETDKGRKIVNAIYYLWDIGLISFYESYSGSFYNANQDGSTTGLYLMINNYIPQIKRLLSQLDEYKKNIETYDEPEKYLEYILSSVAKDINNSDALYAEKLETLKKVAQMR